LSTIKTTTIDNFVCPACGEVIRQVTASDGVVKGWCPHARKAIRVVVDQMNNDCAAKPEAAKPAAAKEQTYLENLVERREKVLKEVVSAREDGDLKENSAYHAAREELSILDDKILQEKERIKRESQGK